MANIDSNSNGHGPTMAETAKKLKEKYPTPEEDNEEEMMTAWDDVSGAALDPTKLQAARAEGITYVRKMKLYTKVPIKECLQKTGKLPKPNLPV